MIQLSYEYDTIGDAIIVRSKGDTSQRNIYRTEPTTEQVKNRKTKK